MDILSTLFQQHSRRIGTGEDMIIPSVVISEKHSDTLEITEYPVERPTSSGGGFIADHAYRRPSEVVMQIGFAGGGSLLDLLDTAAVGLSAGLSPKEVYQKLLDLQKKRVPFDVVTGKRVYNNMLIRALEVTTDRTTENVLSATLTLREVIITQTKSIKVADKADMKYGAETSAVINTGTKTPIPKNDSMLNSAWTVTKNLVGG